MAEALQKMLSISLIIFMAGNLLDMGLKLMVRDAMVGLRNPRFVVQSLLWGFVLCPGLALLLTMIIPLDPAYAMGMVLLGMVPCAPFLPPMVERARGDMGATAAFMLLTLVVTVVYMPLAVPFMVKGLTASPWTIAKPLVFFVVLPLVIGMVIHRASTSAAGKLQPVVKKTTGIATIIMLVLCLVVYGKGFIGAIGSYAIGTQILFFLVATAASYGLSFGLPQGQKSVLALGMATRNIGAALAPLFAVAGVDQRAIVMVALGVPMQTIAALVAARVFARRAQASTPVTQESQGIHHQTSQPPIDSRTPTHT